MHLLWNGSIGFLLARASDSFWLADSAALELDPLNFFLHCFLGWHLVYLHRYEEAIVQLRRTLKSEPNFASAHLGLWGAFYKKRNYEAALREATTFFASIGDGGRRGTAAGRALKNALCQGHASRRGCSGSAGPKNVCSLCSYCTIACARRGRIRALASLEKACDQRDLRWYMSM